MSESTTSRTPFDIDAVLATVREAWVQNPNLRLGQLLFSAGGGIADDARFFSSLEDDLLTERVRVRYIKPVPDEWRAR